MESEKAYSVLVRGGGVGRDWGGLIATGQL
jgi:hypothetical protein